MTQARTHDPETSHLAAVQRSLFGPMTDTVTAIGDIEPCDPNVEEEERPRLAAKCVDVLQRLRQGPATGNELNEICNRYGARLHDLKRAGYRWEKKKVDVGCWSYWLV